jgi:3-oxoacyl-[acyl-carrier-protein] synthase-3
MYVPERVVTNDDLAKLMDTSDEWIQQRSGIKTRRYIEDGQMPSELAERASRRALEAAGLEPNDLDCIILATLSSEAEFPGTSFFLQERLGAPDLPCFDLRAQCSGFVYSLSVANGFVRGGIYRRVLVVGCEVHSTGIDRTTEGRDVAVLFGDGAGAVVVEANDDPEDSSAILEVRLHAQGKHANKLWIEAPGSGFTPTRITAELVEQKRHFPRMQGRFVFKHAVTRMPEVLMGFVFKHAVTRMPEVLMETLGAASLKLEDVDHFLFHQANLRINEHVAGQMEIPPEKCPSNIDRYGNCSAASIPMLLDEGVREGRIRRGQLVAMTTFGSGFSWSSAVTRL